MGELRNYRMDLHIHTCLSPCGDYGMIPEAVTAGAVTAGLDVIGICDHNSARNVEAFREAGERSGLMVLGGMEITTEEEVHLLAFFDNNKDLYAVEKVLQKNLHGENDPEAFGDQIIVSPSGEVIGINADLLIGSVSMGLDNILKLVHDNNGIAVASHVDKEANSIISQLGYFPENVLLDAAEVSVYYNPGKKIVRLSGFQIIVSSDAHFLSDIGKGFTVFRLHEPTVKELRLAFKEEKGRRIVSYGGFGSSYS